MSIVISIIVIVAVIALLGRIYVVNGDKISFFTEGIDSGFKMGELTTLLKLARQCDLETPQALYSSVNSLNKCIAHYIESNKKKGTIDNFKVQQFLEKLYKFRTRIALDKDGKRGLDSTKSLDKGQTLRIIYPGKGVFFSKIQNNGHEIIIDIPKQEDKKLKKMRILPGDEWIGKKVSVYLWRKGDACYAFDSIVIGTTVFQAQTCLSMSHSDSLTRTQKRQSVRCDCSIFAQMYLIKTDTIDYKSVETAPGYKCLLEDISEDGAMIRIGGKGRSNVQIKLQFNISDTFVMMYGVIRAVEYNKALNQSRLHFECTHIEPAMKNAILTFVYNVIPQEEKEINEALMQVEKDSKEQEAENKSIVMPEATIDDGDIKID